jgi:uncharacterized SAM-binding protein YcdF (DUF218 family)
VKNRSRGFKITIGFLLCLTAWIFFAPFLAKNLIVEKPLEHADVILVLAGSSVYQERVRQAASIYKQGVAPKIVLTDDGEKGGWSQIEKRNPPFVELARSRLLAEGVPAEAIQIIKPNDSGTIHEARITREKARQENWKTVLLVTSAYHTRRALWSFEKVWDSDELQFGIVAAPVGEQTPLPNYWWFSPRGWSFVAGEYVKGFYYWLYY